MTSPLRVSAIQMQSSTDKAENLQRAGRLVGEAAARGAGLVVLPEKWTGLGEGDALREFAEPLRAGPAYEAMRSWAADLGIAVVGGSITELLESGWLANTSVAFAAGGEEAGVYRKVHMFDVEVGGRAYRESAAEEAGDEIVACDLAGWRVGMSICYDLRFPELFRGLVDRGARLIVLPAAFTLASGRDHWEVLLRARAIEDQCFVVAANQWGEPAGMPCFGRSMVVDPWGLVLGLAPDEDGVVLADLDPARQDEIRERLPSLRHRRPTVYGPPAADG
jgi:deaminated glutathione amidase